MSNKFIKSWEKLHLWFSAHTFFVCLNTYVNWTIVCIMFSCCFFVQKLTNDCPWKWKIYVEKNPYMPTGPIWYFLLQVEGNNSYHSKGPELKGPLVCIHAIGPDLRVRYLSGTA